MRCCSGRHHHEGRCKGGFRSLLFGMLIGLTLGLMFAPKPGAETINDLKEKLADKLPI